MKNLYSRLAALLLCVFVSLSAWADDKDNKSTSTVLLNKKAATTLGKDKRSLRFIFLHPCLWKMWRLCLGMPMVIYFLLTWSR